MPSTDKLRFTKIIPYFQLSLPKKNILKTTWNKFINRNIAIYMGLTRTEIFTEEQNKLAIMLKALAHPARIAILQQMIKANACICGNLVEDLGLAQSTISQHLKELKNAGLIQGTIEGVSTCYCIEPNAWKLLTRDLNAFMDSYRDFDKCC